MFESIIGPARKLFRPIPLYRRTFPAIMAIMVGAFGGVTVYLLQTKQVVLSSISLAVFGICLSIAQWIFGQLREAARTTWEAVRLYYAEGDTADLITIRTSIDNGDLRSASTFCNFYEKWGRLVCLSYLPIEIFNGPSGVGISNAALKLESFIKEHRVSNPRYAQSYLWLVSQIHKNGYLASTTADNEIPKLLSRLKVG